MYLIGIDIGGTNIKAGLFRSGTGECLERTTLPTGDGKLLAGTPVWAEAVKTIIAGFETTYRTSHTPVGISAPGLAARDARTIQWMRGRMAGLEGFAWADFLGREVLVLNDAHAALVGEVWKGGAEGARDAVMLTLGTGVGGAVMSEGQLLRGHLGRAGHLGHITVNFEGPGDIVGTPGSLEDAVGNATVAHRSGGRFENTRLLLEAAQRGDLHAREVWQRSAKALAAGMVSMMNAFDPEVFILGGGIAAGAWQLLMAELEPELEKTEWRPTGERVRIVPAVLGEWAGAYGAAKAAML